MFCKTLFLWKISGFNTCVWTASVWITRKTLMAEFYEHEKGGGQLAVMSEWPFPRPSRRLGPLQTETSQMKLRRASGAGSIYSQLVSPQLPLTAGAPRYAAMPLRDKSISPASERCSVVTKHSLMTLSPLLLLQGRRPPSVRIYRVLNFLRYFHSIVHEWS